MFYKWMGAGILDSSHGPGEPTRESYRKGHALNDELIDNGEVLPNKYDIVKILKAHELEIKRLRQTLKRLV